MGYCMVTCFYSSITCDVGVCALMQEVRALYGARWELLMPLLQLTNLSIFLCAMCLPAYRVHSLAFGLAQEKVTYTLLGTTLEVMHAASGVNDRAGMALVGTMVLSFVLFFPLIRLATQVQSSPPLVGCGRPSFHGPLQTCNPFLRGEGQRVTPKTMSG
jgi:hypothetical protein